LYLFNLLWIPSIKRHNFFVFKNQKKAQEAPFWEKVNKKHLKDAVMTDAVKKKIDAGGKKFADVMCERYYGFSPENLLLAAKIEAERNITLKVYTKLGLNAEQISKTLDYDLAFVQTTLDNFNKKI
jgi:hypothetical protein